MGGYSADLMAAPGGSAVLGPGAQHMGGSDEFPRVPSEAWLKFLADAFPGLAGALRLASAVPGMAARSGAPTRLAAGGTGLGSLGFPVLSSSSLIRNYADHPTVPTPERPPQTQRSNLQPVQATKTPVPQNTPTRLDTNDNINELARIITSEASNGNYQERLSVGFSVLNRMRREGSGRISDVSQGFAENQVPTSDTILLATRILRGEVADPTNGATHFYSPREMPEEGEVTSGFDVGGGLEQSGDLPKKNYRPGYAKHFSPVKIPEVRDKFFRVYRFPGNEPVD